MIFVIIDKKKFSHLNPKFITKPKTHSIIAWRLAIVMILLQPLIILRMYTRIVILRMSEKAIKAQQESSKLAAEAVSNHPATTAFSSQDQIFKMLQTAQEGPRKETAGLGLGSAQSITGCVIAFDFWLGGKLKSLFRNTAHFG